MLAYDCDILAWMPARQQAQAAMKASAIGWVNGLVARGATGTGPAVVRALQDKDNFTLVLLTDGCPNCIGSGSGTCADHLAMILGADTQRAVVHTFGIAAYGEWEQFCRDIASRTGGKYTHVP